MMTGVCPKCGHAGGLDVRHSSKVIGTEAVGVVALKATAEQCALSMSALKGRSRLHRICLARCVAIVIMRDHGEMSWAQIGKALKRNHSSVLACANKYRGNAWVIKHRRGALKGMRLS